LKRIGPEVRQVIAEKSGHWVHLDEPELVLETIRAMVEQVSPTQVPSMADPYHAETGVLLEIDSDPERTCANVVPIAVS